MTASTSRPEPKKPQGEQTKAIDQDEAESTEKTPPGARVKLRDPESDGMEFPDDLGERRRGDLGTGD